MLGRILMTTMLTGAILVSGDAFAKTTKSTSTVSDTISIIQGNVLSLEGNVRNLTDRDMMVNTAQGNVLVRFADWGGFDPRELFKTGYRVGAKGVVVGHIDNIPVIDAYTVHGMKNGQRYVLNGSPDFKMNEFGTVDSVTLNNKVYKPLPNRTPNYDAISPAAGQARTTEVIESHVETYRGRPTHEIKPFMRQNRNFFKAAMQHLHRGTLKNFKTSSTEDENMITEGVFSTMMAGVILASTGPTTITNGPTTITTGPTTVTTTTYSRPNRPNDTLTVTSGQVLTMDGTVRNATEDSFELRNKYETVRVDFSRWDNFNVGKMFPNGSSVTISGVLNNGLYSQPEIDALTVHRKGHNERYTLNRRMPNSYTSSTMYDLDAIAPAAGGMEPYTQFYEERTTSYSYKPMRSSYRPFEKITGTVTGVSGRDIHLSTPKGRITIDTAMMGYDPSSTLSSVGVGTGDVVTVDASQVNRSNYVAREVISVQKPWQNQPVYTPGSLPRY